MSRKTKKDLDRLADLLLSGQECNFLIFQSYTYTKEDQKYLSKKIIDSFNETIEQGKTMVLDFYFGAHLSFYIGTGLDLDYFSFQIWLSETECVHSGQIWNDIYCEQADLISMFSIAFNKLIKIIFQA